MTDDFHGNLDRHLQSGCCDEDPIGAEYDAKYKRGWNCPYCLDPLMPNHVDDGRIDEGICCKVVSVCFDFIDIEKHESLGLDFYIKREKEGERYE